MRFALRACCALTIPVMLVAFVVDARTELLIAGVVFALTLLVAETGLLDIATDRAWPDEDEE